MSEKYLRFHLSRSEITTVKKVYYCFFDFEYLHGDNVFWKRTTKDTTMLLCVPLKFYFQH